MMWLMCEHSTHDQGEFDLVFNNNAIQVVYKISDKIKNLKQHVKH